MELAACTWNIQLTAPTLHTLQFRGCALLREKQFFPHTFLSKPLFQLFPHRLPPCVCLRHINLQFHFNTQPKYDTCNCPKRVQNLFSPTSYLESVKQGINGISLEVSCQILIAIRSKETPVVVLLSNLEYMSWCKWNWGNDIRMLTSENRKECKWF